MIRKVRQQYILIKNVNVEVTKNSVDERKYSPHHDRTKETIWNEHNLVVVDNRAPCHNINEVHHIKPILNNIDILMSYETRNDNLFYRFCNSISMETLHPIVLSKRQKTWDFILHQGRYSFEIITLVMQKTCLKNLSVLAIYHITVKNFQSKKFLEGGSSGIITWF